MAENEYWHARGRFSRRLYVSSRFQDKKTGEDARFGHRVFPSDALLDVVKKDGEVILRTTSSGIQQIKVKFLEAGREVPILWFQRWDVEKGWPVGYKQISFSGEEVQRLLEFLRAVETVYLPDGDKLNPDFSELRLVHLPDDRARELIESRPEIVAEVARNQITSEDIVALGYRRAQLDRFSRLLNSPDDFEAERVALGPGKGVEDVWQAFFEQNPWIFGYGLSFVFTTGLDEKKLEQTLRGSSLLAPGRRVDALMRTRGAISALCLAEIKRHDRDLLKQGEGYRKRVWTPSAELAGAVAQAQEYLRVAAKELNEFQRFTDQTGAPTGEELFVVQPRSYLVMGNLSEFMTEHGTNVEKYVAFEDYRRHLRQPEIITFDELYERARFIVEHSSGAARGAEASDNEVPF